MHDDAGGGIIQGLIPNIAGLMPPLTIPSPHGPLLSCCNTVGEPLLLRLVRKSSNASAFDPGITPREAPYCAVSSTQGSRCTV